MAGSRPLTRSEERRLVRHIRRLDARDHSLIAAQLFLGFRISEILSLTIGHVLDRGRLRTRVTLPPRFLKGGYGTTRTVPIGPELHRALERYLRQRARENELRPEDPLFLSPRCGPTGTLKAICRSMAEKLIKRSLVAVCDDPQGLSTHSLRKSWGLRLYRASGHDLLVVRDGLGHSSVAVTQVYLPTDRERVEELIRKSDWTRSRKTSTEPRARTKKPAAPLPQLEHLGNAGRDAA